MSNLEENFPGVKNKAQEAKESNRKCFKILKSAQKILFLIDFQIEDYSNAPTPSVEGYSKKKGI